MSFSIRLATQADAIAAAEVVRAVYDEYGFTWDTGGYHSDLYNLQSHYIDQGDYFWVAEDESGKIVATNVLTFHEAIPGSHGHVVKHGSKYRIAGTECALNRLYVHPDGRRQGIGQAMMQVTMDAAADRGKTAIEIWSDKKFEDAHRLYMRFGALIAGERICDDPDESPEWGLFLEL
ncbi:MAG: GNAT family N-acetyltransferase [Fimbriimonadaceae bacterium]|nr:GNAT family N-acetyltransferase [Fimbriimonadaceae bacterium]